MKKVQQGGAAEKLRKQGTKKKKILLCFFCLEKEKLNKHLLYGCLKVSDEK